MLRASITFFILGILSMVLGLNSIAGLSIEIGKILLVVFLVLSILAFFMGKRKGGSLVIALVALMAQAHAADSVTKAAKEAGNDTRRAAKQVARSTQDAVCPLVNGKVACAVQKAKHSVQEASDKVEDAVE